MSDRMRFGFGGSSQYLLQQQQHPHHHQQQNRCALCLDDDRNVTGGVCQHNANVEPALHYLRNFGASVGHQTSASSSSSSSSSSFGGGGGGVSSLYHHGPQSPHDVVASALLQGAFGAIGGGGGGSSPPPPVTPNYYTLAEFLLRRMQQEQQNGYHRHHQGRAPFAGRPPKPKSEMGCLRECAFCKSNGETAEFYKSHFLKDPVGRVRCPILQRYQCPFCYATGENAHTRRYCPKNPNKMCFIKSEQLVKQNLQ